MMKFMSENKVLQHMNRFKRRKKKKIILTSQKIFLLPNILTSG